MEKTKQKREEVVSGNGAAILNNMGGSYYRGDDIGAIEPSACLEQM